MSKVVLGIMGAIPEETNGIVSLLENPVMKEVAMRQFYTGTIHGVEVVVAFSRMGKVSAAATTAILVDLFGVTHLIFTGSAGALDDRLSVGDVVVGTRFIEHDFDCNPLYPRYFIPFLGTDYMESDTMMVAAAKSAVEEVLNKEFYLHLLGEDTIDLFALYSPRLYLGDIAGGDRFIGTDEQKLAITANLPGLLCVEMEGAAVAHVCREFSLPFVVVRYISDSANHEAKLDFPIFIKNVASRMSQGIVDLFVKFFKNNVSLDE